MNNHEVDKRGFFNLYSFNKIRDLSKIDPYYALKEYEKYFESYPDDNAAYTYYISLLITVSEYDKAEKLLDYIEYQLNRNSLYKRNEDKQKHLIQNIIFCKLKLLLFRKKYKEALELYDNNFEIMNGVLGEEIPHYLKKLNGLLDENRNYNESYICRQIRSYSEEDFRDHIKKHLQDYNENNKSISKSYFCFDFPIDTIIDEVRKRMKEVSKLSWGFFEDIYVFKYDGCGRDNDRLVDYFKVVTFSETDNIITMCPSTDCEFFPFLDLNYLNKKEEEEEKVKKISQIDKFNKKWR